MAADFSFLKKIVKPRFSLSFLSAKPARMVGIQIGAYSSKAVQVRHEGERAILETYGELRSEGYLSRAEPLQGNPLRYPDQDIGALLKDLLRESNAEVKEAVCAIPSNAAFVTIISFPRSLEGDIAQAVPYEARKYVPIPISEAVLEWMPLEEAEVRDEIAVLLIAVPREIIDKFRRIAEIAGLNLRALEVEAFSAARALVGNDISPQAIVNLGHYSTALAFVDRRRVRMAHTVSRGSAELTRALERGLALGSERAEAIKREVGLSEQIEEREIVSVLTPLLEALFGEIERLIALYNRRAPRRIQRVNLTGGGSHLKGMVEFAASRLGLEVTRGDPFARLVTPPFLQPVLKEIGPNFSVAIGAALREFTSAS